MIDQIQGPNKDTGTEQRMQGPNKGHKNKNRGYKDQIKDTSPEASRNIIAKRGCKTSAPQIY